MCARLKLSLHLRSPGLRLALPAIKQKTLQQAIGQWTVRLGQASDISVKLRVRAFYRELIALPARTLFRSRSVLHTGIDMPYTQYRPLARRRFPMKLLAIKLIGNIPDICPIDICPRCITECITFPFDTSQCPSGFRLPIIFPYS